MRGQDALCPEGQRLRAVPPGKQGGLLHQIHGRLHSQAATRAVCGAAGAACGLGQGRAPGGRGGLGRRLGADAAMAVCAPATTRALLARSRRLSHAKLPCVRTHYCRRGRTGRSSLCCRTSTGSSTTSGILTKSGSVPCTLAAPSASPACSCPDHPREAGAMHDLAWSISGPSACSTEFGWPGCVRRALCGFTHPSLGSGTGNFANFTALRKHIEATQQNFFCDVCLKGRDRKSVV